MVCKELDNIITTAVRVCIYTVYVRSIWNVSIDNAETKAYDEIKMIPNKNDF